MARAEFGPGARNAVRVCLGINERDRVVLIRDRAHAEIAQAIEEEARGTGATVTSFVMEEWVERPAREFPLELARQIRAAQPSASFFIGGGQPGELSFRQPMLRLLTGELRCRHGHMIGIDDQLMQDGMAADYEQIYVTTRRIFEIVRQAARIDVFTALGTELHARFSDQRRWVSCDGRYHEQGRWGNLPEGEVFTAPESLEGVIVGEEMGDHFASRYGRFEEPVRIEIAHNLARSVSMPGHPEIVAEIENYLAQSPNSSRVGEFAIGTNIGLTQLVGNFLQDEKFPGVHIAFGDPYGAETGADWAAPSHVDVLASHADVLVDGHKIMSNGRFLP
ncbi:MAG TPA: aminopeptidase [Candidatus Acidoferrales bacterium]|nr:aminopeptidase [Candidatus Acidoferrales bacterium]